MTKALHPMELLRRKKAREAEQEKARVGVRVKRAARMAIRAEHEAEAAAEGDLSVPVAEDTTSGELVAVLDAESDPLSTVARVAKAAGLEEKAVRGLLARVRAQYAPVLGELRAVKTKDLIRLVEDRAWMAVELIDRQSLAELNAYQRAIIFGVLVDKARILKGLPTHIVSVEDRRELDKVAGLLLREMERRGMVVDDRGEMLDITPGSADPGRARGTWVGPTEHRALKVAEASEESGEAKAVREGAP